jgi:hypothetical protein
MPIDTSVIVNWMLWVCNDDAERLCGIARYGSIDRLYIASMKARYGQRLRRRVSERILYICMCLSALPGISGRGEGSAAEAESGCFCQGAQDSKGIVHKPGAAQATVQGYEEGFCEKV